MLYRHENAPRRVDSMADIPSAAEPLLKPSLNLRYDRSHADSADHSSGDKPALMGETAMDVNGRVSVGGDHPVRPIELSPAHNESRAERLARIKAEIEAGTYETTEKLDSAVERMMRDVR
ncbi:MAG: hypothetical protein R3B91_17850 [Planctomycetaceae bacterium]